MKSHGDEAFASERLLLHKKALTKAIVDKLSTCLKPLVAKVVEDALGLLDEQHERSESAMVSMCSRLSTNTEVSVASSTSATRRHKKSAKRLSCQSRPLCVERLQASLGSKMLKESLASCSNEGGDEGDRWTPLVVGVSESSTRQRNGQDCVDSASPLPDVGHPFGPPGTPSVEFRTDRSQSHVSWTSDARQNILVNQERHMRHVVLARNVRMMEPSSWGAATTFGALKIVGVLPLHLNATAFGDNSVTAWNRYLVLSLSGCVLIVVGYALVLSLCVSTIDSMLSRTMDMLLAMGSTVALLVSWRLSNSFLGPDDPILELYADRQNIRLAWCLASSRRLCFSLLVWACSCGCRLSMLWAPENTWIDIVLVACFSFASLLFTGLSFSIFHVATSLQLIVDAFCARFEEADFLANYSVSHIVKEWNIVVVVLRAASQRLAVVFFVVQTVAFVLVVLVAASVFLGHSGINEVCSNGPLVIIAMFTFFEVASVTEKCKRAPSFINSLNSGCLEKDDGMHYLVEHISYSGAGFEVFGVLVDMSMALKLLYFSCMSGFTVMTRLVYSNLHALGPG